MSATPTQTCQNCGRVEYVRPDGRGFPPDIAKRRLVQRCRDAGCKCDPTYRAGFVVGPPAQGMSAPDTTHPQPDRPGTESKEQG